MSRNNNGKNTRYIEVVCEHDVTDPEWFSMLVYFNMKLQEFELGKYGNVKAILCDEESNNDATDK